MNLTKVALDKEKLLLLTIPERTFFLALAHLSNELNASLKLLYWAANAPLGHEAHDAGQYSLMLMLVQLVAGKLNEGWRLFERFYFGSKLSKIYHSLLDDEPSVAITNLKRYFSNTNAATIIRNNFSFHYSPDQVSGILPQVENELVAYMHGEAAPNNLFQFSETILSDALLHCLAEKGITMDLSQLAGEFIDVSLWFAQATDGILYAIIVNQENDLRSSDPELIELENLRLFSEVFIPWFTDTNEFLDEEVKNSA